jgi:hypothetical protein
MSIWKMEKMQRPLLNMASLSSSRLRGQQTRGMQKFEALNTRAIYYRSQAQIAMPVH